MSSKLTSRIVLSICLVFCSTVAANASSFGINASTHLFSLNLTSSGFALQGNGQAVISNIPALGTILPVGSVLNLSGSPYLISSDFNTGSVVVNGTAYQIWPNSFPPPGLVSVTVDMVISAGSVIIPVTDDPTVVLTAPITIRVGARGITANFSTVFVEAFRGSGSARVTLQQFQPGHYYAQTIAYQFELIPTPEPTTLILFGSGVVGLIGTACRKRKEP